MCGIFATLRTDGSHATRAEVAAATNALRHRGPDGEGSHLDGPVGLGFRRLAIIDPAHGGQPFASGDGRTVLVGNGELYEADALRRSLGRRGARFRSRSDIEVALHVYLLDGLEAVARLRGMFALCVWDGRRQELVAVRDRFGIKPLCWRAGGGAIRVASEEGAIGAATAEPPALAPGALGRVLTFGYVPGPTTVHEGVRELLAGHALRARADGTVAIEALVQPAFAPDEFAGRADLRGRTRGALEDSVAHHLRSDVPVGAFLSSGIDSAALVALARRHVELPTFSVSVDGAVDEAAMAARTAEALGVEHHRRRLGPADIFGSLPTVVRHLGPLADPSAVALYHLSAFAREHVKVVLSGEGADELFGGYRVYRQPRASRPVGVLPPRLRRRLHGAASRWQPGRPGRGYLLRSTTGVEHWYRGNVTTTTDELRAGLLAGPAWRDAAPRDDLAASWHRSRHLDAVTRMQTVDVDNWLPGDILAKADRASMAHGLEVRVPYLDEHVWSVARQVPTRLRLARGTTKHLLRTAVADLLPREVTTRPKLGFPVPVGAWLRGPLSDGITERLTNGPLGGHFDPKAVGSVVADHRAGRRDHSRLVWALLVLGVWAEEVLAQCPAEPLEATAA